jgi:branched-chain amino acid transport system substrate-binding protein
MSLSKRLLPIAGAAGIIALSACGTSTTTSSSGGGSGIAGCRGTVSVATDLPLTAGDATDGPFPARGAQLAVEQANTNKVLGGCTLKYISKDDATVLKNGHDPAQGAANITALASDSSVMGVVGPFNSTVALAEIPVASQNHLALISPANTNPGLTIAGSNPLVDTPSLYKGPHTYFRVIATDKVQAEELAYVATKELHLTKGYVIDDQELYGAGIATLFKQFLAKDGGTVVGTASLPGTTTTFTTQISNAQSAGAQFIFFGGTTGNGCGLVRRDMGTAGFNVPLLGGDGCQDKKFFTDANSGSNTSEANGAYATSAPDVTKLSSAAKFFSDYSARFASLTPPNNDGKNEPYTAYGYDAMTILIQAIKSAITSNNGQLPSDPQSFRDAVVASLHQVSYSGATGHIAFDQNGDLPPPNSFTLYTSVAGTWTTKETLTVDSTGNITVSH